MIKYNICYIKRADEILLLNREKPSWMGCWNGIGGKLDAGEMPRESMIREIGEETGITEYALSYKGLVTWTVEGTNFGGMYMYIAEVADGFDYPTPVKTEEGILDWKKVGWVLNQSNHGVAAHIPKSLETILHDPDTFEHHCVYQEGQLKEYHLRSLDPNTEFSESRREEHFSKHDMLLRGNV